jgi:hypothetical protein
MFFKNPQQARSRKELYLVKNKQVLLCISEKLNAFPRIKNGIVRLAERLNW